MEQELDSVEITNPTSEDFTWRYNGQPYKVESKKTKSFAKPVSYHLAKHLSTKMVVEEAQSKATKKDLENVNSPLHVQVAQLSTCDTHERRIALYQILGDTNRVVEVVMRYPFKGFIGDMEVYRAYVEKHPQKEATV